MSFGVMSGVGQGIGELDGMEFVEGKGEREGQFWDKGILCMRGSDIALPKLLWDFLLVVKLTKNKKHQMNIRLVLPSWFYLSGTGSPG